MQDERRKYLLKNVILYWKINLLKFIVVFLKTHQIFPGKYYLDDRVVKEKRRAVHFPRDLIFFEGSKLETIGEKVKS